MELVKAEQIISYVCTCPSCEEIIHSEYQSDWDVEEMVYCDQIITCDNCGETFSVGT